MRNINEDNLLIRRFKEDKSHSAPMPNDYPDFEGFLKAHRAYLITCKEDNRRCLGKIFKLMKDNRGNSSFFAFCSGLIHMRKEYGAFLTRGIDSTTRHLSLNF